MSQRTVNGITDENIVMIKFQQGNLLEADVEALVNTVNCVGIMGKGIALQFKMAFPGNFKHYQKACKSGEVQPGKMFIVPNSNLANPQHIINFPTKRHWKGQSRIEDIEAGLSALVEDIKLLGIKSVALPPLGCGNGGLEWAEVAPLILSAFEPIPEVEVRLFEPAGAPTAELMPVSTGRPKMTRGRALIVDLMRRYKIPGYELTRLEIQKLAYFLQSSGEPMKLNYVKHKFGPYADNLNHVMLALEGHYTRGYGDGSHQQGGIYLLPEAVDEANQVLKNLPDAVEHLEKVSRLIEGFETPYAMELLATVHWIAQHDWLAATDSLVAVKQVHAWSKRKATMFSTRDIEMAWQRLSDESFLPILLAAE